MDWRIRAFLICAFGIIKEFRPATPFLTPFLENWPKNFTNVELYSEIYPYSTYSYLLSMVPIFVLTDVLRYKPIVVLEALMLSATWALLIWGQTVFQMQLMQIAFGIASSSEIAYVSFMYAVVDKKHFHKITAYVRTATLVGKFFAFSMAQILVTTKAGSYLLLNQITFGAVLISLIIAILIPLAPKQRFTDHRVTSAESLDRLDMNRIDCSEDQVQQQKPTKARLKSLFSAFKNRTVLIWSIWWALASCGTYQVANYAQTLWGPMQNEGQFIGNGFVECSNTLLSAILTFSLQYYKSTLYRFGDKLFFVSSLFSALLLYCMAATENIFISYTVYVLNSSIYHLLIAAASAIIAAQLNDSNYGLVFGFNTFIALSFQTVLTFLVNDKHSFFTFPIRTQFYIYSSYFALIGVIFMPVLCLNCCFPSSTTQSTTNNDDEPNMCSKDADKEVREEPEEERSSEYDS